MIYLDYSATTPISPSALEVYTSVSQRYYGNSSSIHDFGSSARQILEASAKTIAKTLNAEDKDIHFTSGASEASFLAIYSMLKALPENRGRHIITSSIEHSSVHNICQKLEEEGYSISYITVDESGRLDLDDLKNNIREDTVLASIQLVNSELGTVQDLKAIGSVLKKYNILFHSDMVQGYGRLKLDLQQMPLDALSLSAHKIYGPKGMGAAWINPKVLWKPVFPGKQTGKGFKPGTSDIPSAAAFATAAKEIHAEMESETARMEELRKEFLKEMENRGIEYTLEGNPDYRVPHILGLRFPDMEGQFMMLECNQAGLAISTGSACEVGSENPNGTLLAIGRSEQESREFVRLSFGKHTLKNQIPKIVEKMYVILNRHYKKINREKKKEGMIS